MAQEKKGIRYKHPWLKRSFSRRTRQHLIDYDYVSKLTAEERQWLNDFTREWAGATFPKDETGEYAKTNKHNTKELRRDCYTKNNKRNSCIYTRKAAIGGLADMEATYEILEQVETPEERLERLENLDNRKGDADENGDKSD